MTTFGLTVKAIDKDEVADCEGGVGVDVDDADPPRL